MSGRIPPDRVGYQGYQCDPIPMLVVNCVDCTDNKYGTIPKNLGGVISHTPWHDYQDGNTPSQSVPSAYPRVCSENYSQGFLEVEYPDVPPVSVRGISLYSRAGEPGPPGEALPTCTLCWDYNYSDANPEAYYYDQNGQQQWMGRHPADAKTFDKSEIDYDRYAAAGECGFDFSALTFVDCPCKGSESVTRKVITKVWIDDDDPNNKQLKYRYEDWVFEGERLQQIMTTHMCDATQSGLDQEAETGNWDEPIVDVDDCPATP